MWRRGGAVAPPPPNKLEVKSLNVRQELERPESIVTVTGTTTQTGLLKRKQLLPYWLLIPTVGLLFILNIFPFVYSVIVSFTSYNTFGKSTGFAGFDNYLHIFQDIKFWTSLGITVLYTVLVVSIEMVIGLTMALLLWKEAKFQGILRWVLIIPMMLSPLLVGIIWRLMLNTDMGIINYMLEGLGFSRINWTGEPLLAFLSVVLVDVWQWTPMCFLIILAGLQSLPQDPYEAARIDGASRTQIFRDITLPLLKPVLLVALLIRSMDAFRIFDQIFVITQGGPGQATETISLLMYKTAYKFSQFGIASAGLFIVMVLTVWFSKALIKRLNNQLEA
jgi:multiple sugar transport system permease protein